MRQLTAVELCEQSGLSLADLEALEIAGLLKPTNKVNRTYRLKLASWGKKLAYLLGDGWTTTDIQQWASERWTWPNPRVWPPPKPGKRPIG